MLRAVTRGVPADFVAPGAQLADLYLIVNAVDGLAPGATSSTASAMASSCCARAASGARRATSGSGSRSPPTRRSTCSGWATCRECSAHSATAATARRRSRPRSRGGKTYLAAYALRLGASGLTFFDDDVTAFFSPHARGKSVLFLMAVGVPQRLPAARASR